MTKTRNMSRPIGHTMSIRTFERMKVITTKRSPLGSVPSFGRNLAFSFGKDSLLSLLSIDVSLSPSRNVQKFSDGTNQTPVEISTINLDYCQLNPKTLQQKPYHRAGFFFNKRGAARSMRQVGRSTATLTLLALLAFRITNACPSINTTVSLDSIRIGRRNISPRRRKIRSPISGSRHVARVRVRSLHRRSNRTSPIKPLIFFAHPIVTCDTFVSWTAERILSFVSNFQSLSVIYLELCCFSSILFCFSRWFVHDEFHSLSILLLAVTLFHQRSSPG